MSAPSPPTEGRGMADLTKEQMMPELCGCLRAIPVFVLIDFKVKGVILARFFGLTTKNTIKLMYFSKKKPKNFGPTY